VSAGASERSEQKEEGFDDDIYNPDVFDYNASSRIGNLRYA
jgi:hypothetical protein